ncbi:MAG: 50S ribosomal protein L13 [Parcubacteria group bacterium GW2011_GWA2_33_14]|uniref:Large ribosomal subunit protein uL13 n=1 Tax=Candidatus Staskawiczbacteria bacterium RIFCSPHIGHO2_02_FULL_33_16 TaxID=1802204 RepID=A0A1G2HYE4_9BACT|nr:MAG: 50S ribosomal protein L13 [Parcubacteria group bacterium GW2011_GWA2_33_14]OGZ67562.1 MAG: 50S ribosomal protein L13 [Candidatus Staskawiczbacteria bacterium RIFCSPHIGHO2_02_FULL_33_16]OGZ70050.1 MAG: 50S ribosomal protein L13 [Candidatus Staskawiczbacteria bacterium RIFCSPLOWO2_01_FULL_33_13]
MDLIKRENHIIDATDKVLGRLATQVVVLLRGKSKVGFAPYKDIGDFVTVKNVDKLKFTGKKFTDKIYYHHTLYLGGLKKTTMKEIKDKKGTSEIFRKAVMGMLTKNKLRAKQIKRLRCEK